MREKELATKVIFVRHGQTDFPLDRIYCDDREDPELNQSGKSQAQSAGHLLKHVGVDAIYASPALRTVMTAKAIAEHHSGLTIEYREALRERRFGVWEGLFFGEIEQGFPEDFLLWKKDQAGFSPEGGESAYDLHNRALSTLSEIISENEGKTVVVVSHVGPIRVLLADAVGMPVANFRSLRIDPASLSRVDFGKKQNNLVCLNYVGLERWQGL